jgi:hypothetical protein
VDGVVLRPGKGQAKTVLIGAPRSAERTALLPADIPKACNRPGPECIEDFE